MDELLEVRNLLSAVGLELTLDETKSFVDLIGNLRSIILLTWQHHPNFYEDLADLSAEDKNEFVHLLMDYGIETTPEEFDRVCDLLLKVYAEEVR